MTSANEAAPAGAPLFYSRPVPVQADAHADVRILKADHGFTARNNAIPLVVGEFAQALHHYPILFAGKSGVPMAALGLTEDNLFVSNGEWDDASYIPAYVRRHPFIFIDVDDGRNFVLGLDADSPRVVHGGDEGNALFVDGKPTDVLNQAMEFCGQFTREHMITQEFAKGLAALDLLVERSANVRLPDGNELNLNGFYVVDVEKFGQLPDATVLEWHRKGWLALVHQHLMSLHRFSDLSRRQAARTANAAQT